MRAERAQILISVIDETRAALTGIRTNLEGLATVGNHVKGALAGIGVALSLDALVDAGQAALDTADELSKLSQKTGISVETLSLLRPIAEQAGVSLESLAKGLQKLATAMVETAGGAKEPGEAFKRLGVSVVDTEGQLRPTEDVLLDLADAFAAMPDGAEKSALAVKLFGKSGVELIPFLNQGRAGIDELKQKFKDLGLEISGDTARAAETFNDTLDTVKQTLHGLSMKAAEAALPALQSMADTLVSIASNGQQTTIVLQLLGETIVSALAIKGATAVATLIGGLGNLRILLGRLLLAVGLLEAARGISNLAAQVRDANKTIEDTQRSRDNIRHLSQALDELANTGAVSLESHLWLAAQAAERLTSNLPATATALRGIQGAATEAGNALNQALETEHKQASQTIKHIGDSYKQIAGDIKGIWDGRIATIEANYKRQETAALQASTSEANSIRQLTQLMVGSEREKLAAVENAGRQMESAWKTAYSAAITLARGSGQEIQAVERQSLETRISIYGQMEAAYRATIDRLIAEEQRHLTAARAADEARLNLRLSVEDRIRELSRKGMDDYAAYQDRLKQIDEKQTQARAALNAGNFEQARKLAEDSIALAERSASEVTRQVDQHGKSITQTLVSEGRAASSAIIQIRESASIADEALAGLGNAHRNAATAASTGASEAQQALSKVAGAITELRQQLLTQDKLSLNIDVDAATASLSKIQAITQAQQLIATLQVDTKTAQASLDQLKADAKNLTLVAQVETDATQVLSDIDNLKSLVASSRIELPAIASFDQPREQLAAYALDAQVVLSAPSTSTHTVQPDAGQVQSAIADLQRPTSSTHTIYVQKVGANASGGLIQRFAEGGQVLTQSFQRLRGKIYGSGTETSDSIRALLSKGEYVIQAASVRKFGERFFDAVNAGFLPALPQFAGGGAVTQAISQSIYAESAVTSREVVDLNFNIGNKTYRAQSSRETAMQLAQALRELSRGL